MTDIKTKATVPNAVTLYEKLSTISIRQIPPYNNFYSINQNLLKLMLI